MRIQEFFELCKKEFGNHFRESMGFTIKKMTRERNGYLYTTLRAVHLDWYTPVVDFMMCADGQSLFVISGYNEDDDFVEIGSYELQTRDIERVQIILRYILVSAVLRFHENNKLKREWGFSHVIITDEWQ